MTKPELLKGLKELGVDVTGEESYNDLKKLYSQHSKQGGSSSEKSQTSLVWLKSRAYVDSKIRVDSGLYQLEEIPERLVKLPSSICEVFADGVIPPRKLYEIAKWAGISHPEDKDDDELLRVLISEYRPFN